MNFDVIVLNLFNGLDLGLVKDVGLLFLFFLLFVLGLDVADAGFDDGFKLSGGRCTPHPTIYLEIITNKQ